MDSELSPHDMSLRIVDQLSDSGEEAGFKIGLPLNPF